LTSGYLPVAAFRHLEPTAVGVVDLDRPVTVDAPDGRAWEADHRDGLLLVRMHRDPLAVIHLDRRLTNITQSALSSEIWPDIAAAVARHIEQYDCLPMPDSAHALAAHLDAHDGSCRAAIPVDPGASVAVILSTAGRDEQLARCVRSLLAQRRAELEIVVVDNRPGEGATRHVVEAIAADDPRVRYVPERRIGLSVARNRGVFETDAELVAFTDDDVVADPGWLEWLLAPFADANITATCGMVLPLELRTSAQKHFEQYAGFSKGTERHSYDLQAGPAAGRLLYPFLNGVIGVGNNMAFRRAELISAGGFDPALGAGSPAGAGEETCAFSRLILRGGQIVYEPRALCWHEHRRDGDALRRQVFGYGVGVGAIMTKALATDPRFCAAAARSLPIALGVIRDRHVTASDRNGSADVMMERPEELLRARREGILRGPLRYAAGVVRARKLRLGDVIHGG
jgi:GT2 family glycosyltransferase